MTMEKVVIYDTTLRDGMQAEGVSFSLQDKLLIASRLDQLGVDYIEGGYPSSNPKETQFFRDIVSRKLTHARVASFGNTRRADATVDDDASIQSLKNSGAPAATLVGKSWDMHVTTVLRCSLDENLKICSESVAYLKKSGIEVIFDAEHFFDGFRESPEYAMKVLQAAADAGASTLALCDTNGGNLPDTIFDIVAQVRKTIPGIIIGIHCHNDSDSASANSLSAVRAGARHVQGTINGLGERTGNANLCTIIPNLAFKMGFSVLTDENIKLLTEMSRYVFEVSNVNPVRNMPYVGESAFAHKAGLHVDALRKNKRTYEHIDPSAVGNERRFLVSELSGKSNVLAKLEKANIAEDKTLAKKILEKVQDLENEGYEFEAAEASFDLLVKKTMGTYKSAFTLDKYFVTVGRLSASGSTTEASVKISVDGRSEHTVSEGDGPINALDAALRKAMEKFYPTIQEMRLFDYKVRVVNAKAGTAAKVRVIIESRDKATVWGTVGVSENVIDASWKALVDSFEYKLVKDGLL
jgi:2-isopropylmalate synthase